MNDVSRQSCFCATKKNCRICVPPKCGNAVTCLFGIVSASETAPRFFAPPQFSRVLFFVFVQMAASSAAAAPVDGKIAVYVRVRPHERAVPGLVEVSADRRRVSFPRGEGAAFTFNHVFDVQDDQEEVFERCAVPNIMSALDGYNATIFAYGQTGSGACKLDPALPFCTPSIAQRVTRVHTHTHTHTR